MIHKLKIEDNYLENLISGAKKSEIRFNDRDYQKGDMLRFYRSKEDQKESGYFYFAITHIHSGLGLKDGYVVLSVNLVIEDK